ncbi:hypothetical protein BG30_16115 [Bacillus subtilis subsp. subtilis]|nr:hypothetical protein BG30_16115 [Bacillus subtilis subsp. subtilis]
MPPSADFQEWPLPYAGNQDQTTLIVLPDTVSQSKLEELSLVTESSQHSYTVKKSSDVTANDAKGRNLIFIGGINQIFSSEGEIIRSACAAGKERIV